MSRILNLTIHNDALTMKLGTTFFFLLALVALADDLETDPCPNDTTGYCMNQYAIKYTNQLRSAPLVSGSISMFDNAMKHSIDQDRKGDIFHQPLQNGIRVGSGDCRTTLSGENVAYYRNRRIKNAAMYCVLELWKNSDGHYKNMINRSFKSVVIAIYRNNGRITCTQTFSRDVPRGTGQCAAALPSSAQQARSTEPEPAADAPKDTNPPAAEEIPVIADETAAKKEETPMMEEEPAAMKDEPAMNKKMSGKEGSHTTQKKTKEESKPMNKEVSSDMHSESGKKGTRKEKGSMMQKNDKYTLKYKYLTVTSVDGTEKKLKQECFSSGCYYCVDSSNLCYGRRASGKLDRMFSHFGF